MRIPELSWPVEPLTAYDEDLLLEIHSVSVAILIRGRNAWHSTWVQHYLRNAALYTDVASAKSGAESQRGPGNVFYIVEAPALQLTGVSSSVVICDAHPDNPFGRFTGVSAEVHRSSYGDWVGGVFPGVSVKDAVYSFRFDSGYWAGPQPNPHSLRSGRLGHPAGILRSSRRYASLVSRPVGADYLLDWIPRDTGTRYTRRGTNAVARQWDDMVAATVGGGLPATDLAKSLTAYRDNELRATPRSLWQVRREEQQQRARSIQSRAAARWLEQWGRVQELTAVLNEAQDELVAARADRMRPADTAEGMRLQRERVQTAVARVESAHDDLADAQRLADELLAASLGHDASMS